MSIRFSQISGVLAASLLLFAGIAPRSHAAVVIVAEQSGGDVVFSMASGGSLDLTNLSFLSSSAATSSVRPNQAVLLIGAEPSIDRYSGASGPTAFGTGTFLTIASSSSGDSIGIDSNGILFVGNGYVSGELLGAGSSTFSGQSYASLGITEGSYVWSWAGDSLTLNVTAVPVPAAFWLFGSAICLLGFRRRMHA